MYNSIVWVCFSQLEHLIYSILFLFYKKTNFLGECWVNQTQLYLADEGKEVPKGKFWFCKHNWLSENNNFLNCIVEIEIASKVLTLPAIASSWQLFWTLVDELCEGRRVWFTLIEAIWL